MSDFGVVPDGWEVKSVSEICKILDSERVPLNSQERAIRQGIYPYYGANGVQDYIDDFIFEGEAILLAEDGGNFEQYAQKPIAYLVSGKYWVNNHAHILKVKQPNITRFIFYSFEHKDILQFINGGTRSKLNQLELRKITINIPSLSEQKKIAEILTAVDKVIEKTAAQISKLRDLKKAMMFELLTKGIGHTEFKDSSVGRIPAAWEVKKLDQVAIVQTGIAKNKNISGDLVEVPYLRVANVQDGFFDLSEVKTIRIPKEKLSRFLLKTHDILVNEGGDFDKLGRGNIWNGQVTPCVHQNHVFAVRVQQDILLPEFFNYVSGSDYGKKYYLGCAKQTTNLASINSSQLKMFQVILPPLSEQKKISQAIRTVDQKIKLIQQKLTQTKTLKKALMHDLLTGKKRVKVAVD